MKTVIIVIKENEMVAFNNACKLLDLKYALVEKMQNSKSLCFEITYDSVSDLFYLGQAVERYNLF